ncbi:hypothetical protein K431DRAFT_291544 [Polychaeton citri CBS 116435]|uniref:Uncharacterized protein n=1 Tax=Polychaeton citri CBS 116435 TaxID=1314669 RepID=A0A9P4UT78_9PEZI|nr:hypothetical protein K431DRAFT_291544 [Polychaeton citri CBS 116435]
MTTPQYLERMQRRNYMDRSAFVDKPAPPPYSAGGSKASVSSGGSTVSGSTATSNGSALTTSTRSRLPDRPAVPPPEYTREIESLQAQLMRSCIVEDRTNVGLDFDGKKEDRVLKKLSPRRLFGGGKKSQRVKDQRLATAIEDWQSGKAKGPVGRPYTSTG